MTCQQLLAQLETLPYSERIALVIKLARDEANAGLLDELERGATVYERHLAIISTAITRDGERILRLLQDRSRLIRSAARVMVSQIATEEQIGRACAFLSAKEVTKLAMALRKCGRQSALDALVSRWQSENSFLFERTLPYASPTLLENWSAVLFERGSGSDLTRLCRLAPRYSLEKSLELAQQLGETNRLVLHRGNLVLSMAYRFRDAAGCVALALQLVRELNRHFPLSEIQLRPLLQTSGAQAIAELVLESDEKVYLPLGWCAKKLRPETLVRLLESDKIGPSELTPCFKKLPIQTRGELFERSQARWQNQSGAVSATVVALLPRKLRHREALRHFSLANVTSKPVELADYAALLPFEENVARCAPFIGDPDPEIRAAMLAARVRNARFEPDKLDEILSLIANRKNEQDPVRMAMLGALASLPPMRFKAQHLPVLGQIIRDSLDARDLSHGTVASLQTLVVALLPNHPAWAGEQTSILIKERGYFAIYSLESRVNDAQMTLIGPILEPILRAWTKREHHAVFSVLGAFGKRLKSWEGGTQILVEQINNGAKHYKSTAAQLLVTHRGDLWQKLAPDLIKKDESWALFPFVQQFLHLSRQDLLTPAILGRRKLDGQFQTGKTRCVLSFTRGFHRWTPAQQGLFSLTLGDVLLDESRDSPGAFYAINRLCELPDVSPDLLLKQAMLENPKPAWREAALRVLSRLDGGQGVPTLLESLDDERARIAIYGLRRAILEMPVAPAIAILRDVNSPKITVQKEVARLLGELPGSESLEMLLHMSARELHRDVRVALLRALWESLEDARVWPVLESAAQSDDPAISTMVARTQSARLSPFSRAKLVDLLALCLKNSEARVRLQALENPIFAALQDTRSILLDPLLDALTSPVEAEANAAALAVWNSYAAQNAAAISLGLEKLLGSRRDLERILEIWNSLARWSNRHQSSAITAISTGLANHLNLLPLRLRWAQVALGENDFARLIEDLEAQNALYPDALWELRTLLQSQFRPAQGASLHLRWKHSQSPTLRWLALAGLVGSAQGHAGWNTAQREALRKMQNDDSAWVQNRAQTVFPPRVP